MPAPAVTLAPIAYIKVVAVKKLVVEFVSRAAGSSLAVSNWRVRGTSCRWAQPERAAQLQIPPRCSSLSVEVGRHVYFEQIRVLKAG